MIYNPSVIAKILSTQSNYIDRKYRQMFYYVDTNQIWYDTQDNNRVRANDIYILQFERERNNFIPNRTINYPTEPGMEIPATVYQTDSLVYVVETNCLYRYSNSTWTTIYGLYGTTVVAQTYLPDGTIKNVYPDDVTNNGILNDGSVVIRDGNRMLCGQVQSDGYVLNLLSLIGGCINIDPSGSSVGAGCLQLNASINNTEPNVANLNGNLKVFGNIETVPASNWEKQYRLATENIQITVETTITTGSTLLAGSKLDDTTYSEDTVLTEDITATTGLIVKGSKLYKNSVINQQLLQPPFMFDTDSIVSSSVPIVISSTEATVTNNVLSFSFNTPFKNNGDSCYILTKDLNLQNVTAVAFNKTQYTVSYKATEGINDTAKIVYYAINNTVKILP
nr:hypothetical protein DGKKSRWO_DGKKSRWO_CDS_0007 [uncultured phage]CAI9752105.1 hypothetical protein CVNMHQAP_CVNMHQAP_CDS_0007 [uncultured phage]